MSKRKYKFTRKRQSRLGIMATITGMVAIAYLESGAAGKVVAVPAFLALLLALLGFFKSIQGIREEDTYRFFPWMGFILNGMTLIVFGLIYTVGW